VQNRFRDDGTGAVKQILTIVATRIVAVVKQEQSICNLFLLVYLPKDVEHTFRHGPPVERSLLQILPDSVMSTNHLVPSSAGGWQRHSAL